MSEAVTDYGIEEGVFPADLLQRDRWFVWSYDDGRKIPRAPWVDGCGVEEWQSWKDEAIWTDYETVAEWVDKVGALEPASCIPPREQNAEKRLVFFDFDNCRDPETGAIHPHAWAMVVGEERDAMHGALSTSGTGIHGYAWASIPDGYKPSFEHELADWAYGDQFDEAPHMEVYAADRFLALTGQHIATTPVAVPDLDETVHELFQQFGSERLTGTEREPDVSREEVAAMDATTDIEDVFDAVAHVRPSDIRIRSTVTEERADGTKSLDPSWEQSDSGTRLAQLDDHWLYRKGNHHLDALQLVALEERIITDPATYPSDEAFWDAVAELRARGANIPELKSYDLSGGDNRDADAAEAAAVADGAGVATEPAADDGDGGDDGGGDGGGDDAGAGDGEDDDPWDEIYHKYASAEDADERLIPRFEAVEQLTTESSWRTLVENDQLWKYDPDAGIYRPDGETRARQRLVEQLAEQFRANEQREICEQIRGRTPIREEQFGGPPNHIATENCVLEVRRDDITVHDHSPEFEFVGRCQTEYDPDAECPRFKAFVRESVDSEGAAKTLQEYAGYALMHWRLPYHKALFLVGPTASGKSTFLDTIRAMLGQDAVASLTPQQMTSERFGGAELYGKWANIRNDIPASVIEDTGQFKEITAGDPIKAEEKFKDPFMFEPAAKHMFSANQLPEADTDDEAFFRRILLVAFPTTVPRGERDPKLDDKLQAELPGVLNWCLDGLQRLMKQGRFTLDRSPGETQDTWEKWGNSVSRFEKLCLEERSGDDLAKSEVYTAYVNFCEDEGIPTETQHMLTRELKLEGYEDGRAYVDGGRERVFHNVGFTGRGEQYAAGDSSDDDDGATGGGGGLDSY